MIDDIWHKKTVETYNKSSREFAQYFATYSRKKYIQQVFELIECKENPLVVEIGCGNGRDAKDIIEYTHNYIGFDPSRGFIEIAKKHVPEANFIISDALNFDYPSDIDAVFAFASLLHVNIDELELIFKKLSKSIKIGGALYISLKYSPIYKTEVKKDQYGERIFYLYNSKIIQKIAGQELRVIYLEENLAHGTSKNTWLEMLLRKT